jgi:hypothetical protein
MNILVRVTITRSLDRLELYFNQWPNNNEIEAKVIDLMTGFRSFGVPPLVQVGQVVEDSEGRPAGVRQFETDHIAMREHQLNLNGVRVGVVRVERIPT